MSTTSKHRKSRASKLLVTSLSAAAFAAIAAAGLVAGCVGDPPSSIPKPIGTSSSGTASGGMDAGPTTPAEELFAELLPTLFSTCGVCHDVGGLADTPFLAGPDRYQSMVSWPGLVVKDWTQSLLLTYSITGGKHSGVNLDGKGVDETLKARVQAWLMEESKSISEPPPTAGPAISSFTPIMGFNAVYLGPLGAEFEGMAVTFNAEALTSTTLELTNIEVHPTSKLGVHIVHPLLVVFPLGGEADPDPIDSFSNVDSTYVAGASGTLGPGTAVLTNWKSKAKLSIAFETIEVVDPGSADAGDAGPTSGCKDVAGFQANAEPLFSQRCSGCHGGNNGGATGALDMTDLNKDSAKACEQIRYRVSPDDPPKSQIFITTDPGGNAAHPYKFGGNQGNFDSFEAAVSKWIAAEK